MASRQSLRLRGLGPELSLFQDKCFICRLDLDIASVTRCHVMDCCGKFIHQRCFRKARETSFQCGHCRIVADDDNSNSTASLYEASLIAHETLDESDDNPRTVPEIRVLIDRARTAIADRRASAMAHRLHIAGNLSWEVLPYRIDPMVWYLFWVNFDWFLSTNPDGPHPMYIHAAVYTPVWPFQRVRKTMYQLINECIPDEVRACVQSIFYRLRFYPIQEEPMQGLFAYPFDRNEISFTHIRITRFWSSTPIPEDFPYTTDARPRRRAP